MVTKHKDQRVGVFIDTQNLYHSARSIHNAKVNFGAVVKALVADRRIVRAIAYVVASESREEAAFFEALRKSGIETKEKDLQVFSNGAKKADWDVGLAIDAVRIAPKLDVAIIVSGDGDFVPLVEYLRSNGGCQVEAAAFGRSTSGKLREAVDDFTDLDKDSSRFLIGPRRASAPAAKEAAPEAVKVPAAPVPAAAAQPSAQTADQAAKLHRRRGRRGGRGRGKKGEANAAA
jgi:uncharacterized LabA/DUF88 family protein